MGRIREYAATVNGYADRRDAGRQLGAALERFRSTNPVILGVPRGGVVIAEEVRAAIGGDLDLVVARKLGAPGNPELAIGAVAADGVPYVDEYLARRLGVTPDRLEAEVVRQTEEVHRRLAEYRGDRPPVEIAGRAVIVVDDGVATGATLRTALRQVRRQQPAELCCAVPVGPEDTLLHLGEDVDEVVCPLRPPIFRAVGEWYDDFRQVSDAAVMEILARAWA